MIDRIGNQCTGCYACVNACSKHCITMEDNSEGFWFPQIDFSRCIHCNLCEKSCPVLTPIPIQKTEKDISVYALQHKDEGIRSSSSSGGAFSAIAEYVLSNGGVVFGAAFDENYDVHHICVDNVDNLYKLRGSKYVQSRIGNTFQEAKKYLDNGILVLFSGTACQTSGLLSYLGHDYDNLITQDLICHGVPSPMVWRKYLKWQTQLERSKISSIFFRDKHLGWHNWHMSIRFQNGVEYSKSQHEDLMIQSFLHGKCSRECCYDCPFKQKYRLSDFTLADYWGIQDIAPELDDDCGLSSCYVNSNKATNIIDDIKNGGNIKLYKMDLDSAIQKNLAMIESEEMRPDRKDFLRSMHYHSFDLVARSFLSHPSLLEKILWTIQRIMGIHNYNKLKALFKRGQAE